MFTLVRREQEDTLLIKRTVLQEVQVDTTVFNILKEKIPTYYKIMYIYIYGVKEIGKQIVIVNRYRTDNTYYEVPCTLTSIGKLYD